MRHFSLPPLCPHTLLSEVGILLGGRGEGTRGRDLRSSVGRVCSVVHHLRLHFRVWSHVNCRLQNRAVNPNDFSSDYNFLLLF